MTLIEAIIGKMSHDLAGSVGAISSTVDLLTIDPTFQNEASPLLKTGSSILMARLRFYRALFGEETKTIDHQLIQDYLKTLGQQIDFFGNPLNRLDLSFICVGISLLGQGGVIHFKKNELILKGNEILGRPEFKEILLGKNIPLNPENVEIYWFLNQLKENHLKLESNFKKTSAKLSILN